MQAQAFYRFIGSRILDMILRMNLTLLSVLGDDCG